MIFESSIYRIFGSNVKSRSKKSRAINLIKYLESRIKNFTDFDIFGFSIFRVFESSDFIFSKDCRTHAITQM